MSLVTFAFMRAGQDVFTGYDQTTRAPQEYADLVAARTNPGYADEVHVWFAQEDEPDVRRPDAIAKVPR
jgi:hypothetical protein